ncbi:MAG TPA: acyclic terpene utilization AtuA family protein, partial [Burkholderiales bacterium]|nr:acyclic terpene utilization AtuA family protein [Burkholderiales bacterium]
MAAPKQRIRVGTGAGFSDDRFEPAVELAERGAVDYLAFECLAERTIARETLTRLKDPERGYTPYLIERFQAVLPACRRNGVTIVTNMGAANPLGAAKAVRREAKALGLGEFPIAVVSGDDVTDIVRANP